MSSWDDLDVSFIRDPQTRLQRFLERKNGEIISPDKISWLFSGDYVEALDALNEWILKHENDCIRISNTPLQVRISIPVDRKFNKAIHENNMKKPRGYGK
jgi:hypothetical protein